jgi:hypothetical protein
VKKVALLAILFQKTLPFALRQLQETSHQGARCMEALFQHAVERIVAFCVLLSLYRVSFTEFFQKDVVPMV